MNLEDILLRDDRASQPLATAVAEGSLYYVTDEGVTEQSRGGVWVDYSDAGSSVGGITQLTGAVTAGPGTGSQAASIANDAVTTGKVINDAITYAKIQNVTAPARVLGRKTAGAGDIEELTLSEILDFITSAAHGDVLYRGAAVWERLAPGVSGQVLQTNGAGFNPQWSNAGELNFSVLPRTVTELEIETWSSAPIEIVAAPGVNKIIVPILVQWELDVTVSYGSAPTISFIYAGDTTNRMAAAISTHLTGSGKRQTWVNALSASAMDIYALFDPRNKAFQLKGSFDPGSGGAATGRLNLMYMTATVSS